MERFFVLIGIFAGLFIAAVLVVAMFIGLREMFGVSRGTPESESK